jgi:hypothetical protein
MHFRQSVIRCSPVRVDVELDVASRKGGAEYKLLAVIAIDTSGIRKAVHSRHCGAKSQRNAIQNGNISHTLFLRI